MNYKLELTSLEKAINSLEIALIEYKNNSNDFVRDSCIQRFEFVYDLSHKMLRRHLLLVSPNTEIIQTMSFPTLIRTGAEQGMLQSSWDKWKEYRTSRNKTSHTYDEEMAIEVLDIIPSMLQEAQYLLNKLQEVYNA